MASFADLNLRYRIFMRTYRYRSCDWAPGTEMTKSLTDSSVAVVTSAAFYAPDQEAFDESAKGGDVSYRVISSDTDLNGLRIGHRSSAFDPAGIIADKNLALPLDRLREMKAEGKIGSLSARHFSFMGSVTAPGRLITRTAPDVAGQLREDGVDVVLLTPV